MFPRKFLTDEPSLQIAGICRMISSATIVIYSLPQGVRGVRKEGVSMVGGGGSLPDHASVGTALGSPRGLRWNTPPPQADISVTYL